MISITNIDDLKALVAQKLVSDVDISELSLDGISFSGCTIRNVVFAKENQDDRIIRHVDFQNAKFDNVFFDHAELFDCNFDGKGTEVNSVSFKKCKLEKCRFRRTQFSWCDFRYAEINFGTFEEAFFLFCDFYRCFFIGIIIFRKAKFDKCSLFYT